MLCALTNLGQNIAIIFHLAGGVDSRYKQRSPPRTQA